MGKRGKGKLKEDHEERRKMWIRKEKDVGCSKENQKEYYLEKVIAKRGKKIKLRIHRYSPLLK